MSGTDRVMTDNGFGGKANPADALLRTDAVAPDFKVASGGSVVGSGAVNAVADNGGAALPAFSSTSFVNLRDPDRKLGFTIQAD